MSDTRTKVALGLDFGTESVRAVLFTLDGREVGSASCAYADGQITRAMPESAGGAELPADYALQNPQDWLDASAQCTREAVAAAGVDPADVVGIGVDFTSCTMLPCTADGTPLCRVSGMKQTPLAWPKLWKHHGAKAQTDRINAVAAERDEPWLKRYGGVIGLEWFWPKVLETLENAPAVYDAAEVWIEAGDWYVWQLVGAGSETPAAELARSTCQAGYKACWTAETGYPSPEFFAALNPKLRDVVAEKMPGRMRAPGERAGGLAAGAAERMGLRAGTPVAAATIDAHAGVPGVGVGETGTLVLVMGTSSCHMLMGESDASVPGVAGVVKDGILPGSYGFETGQAAVGDGFAWLRNLLGHDGFEELDAGARALPPGAEGVGALDWMNGCRTPLMDGRVAGAFTGLTLNHGPAHLYRALLEASAMGVRWIVETLENGGVPVKRIVATGGLPHHNPLLMQIQADVLGRELEVHPNLQGPATGAAILGAMAAGRGVTGFVDAAAAVGAMAGGAETKRVTHDAGAAEAYGPLYARYRETAAFAQGLVRGDADN